jgi:hypothetical protein
MRPRFHCEYAEGPKSACCGAREADRDEEAEDKKGTRRASVQEEQPGSGGQQGDLACAAREYFDAAIIFFILCDSTFSLLYVPLRGSEMRKFSCISETGLELIKITLAFLMSGGWLLRSKKRPEHARAALEDQNVRQYQKKFAA